MLPLRWIVVFSFSLLLGIGVFQAVHALDPADEKNVVNYSVLSEIGIGGYDVGDREVRAFQIPFSYQLRPMLDDQFGIKILFPITLATADVDAINVEEIVLPFDTKIVAAKPGLELQFPLRPNWALKPFGKIGLGQDISEGNSALLYSLGLKSRYSFPFKDFRLAFGAGISFEAYAPSGERQNDFTNIGIGLDATYPLGLTLFGRKTHIGGYLAYYYYLDELEFDRIFRTPIEINDQIEVAMTFGVYDPIPILLFSFERIGLAYRFSEELKAISLVFEFPF
ncbi:hypothetical protein ACFL9T_09720 [Thermodesulfobacteriota bacterium]